ncbi:hypothetical protein B6N60_03985 [Richelia sinica FACHB-800]|uniref:Uncharacterized protein n=2 Tax=Richelia TaxID=98443 RepID=A0A975TCA5_9NOST|nr:hypothetical protein [Richelia sinica]QXE25271.1 hypothetical protein B6N60_03985 [Richelia sinica FACHB-800]
MNENFGKPALTGVWLTPRCANSILQLRLCGFVLPLSPEDALVHTVLPEAKK